MEKSDEQAAISGGGSLRTRTGSRGRICRNGENFRHRAALEQAPDAVASVRRMEAQQAQHEKGRHETGRFRFIVIFQELSLVAGEGLEPPTPGL